MTMDCRADPDHCEERIRELKARVAELEGQRDARTRLLRGWMETPFFATRDAWSNWAGAFHARILDVLEAREKDDYGNGETENERSDRAIREAREKEE